MSRKGLRRRVAPERLIIDELTSLASLWIYLFALFVQEGYCFQWAGFCSRKDGVVVRPLAAYHHSFALIIDLEDFRSYSHTCPYALAFVSIDADHVGQYTHLNEKSIDIRPHRFAVSRILEEREPMTGGLLHYSVRQAICDILYGEDISCGEALDLRNLDLTNCSILSSPDTPEFVEQAISDLIEYTGGRRINGTRADAGVVVLVGKKAVRQAAENSQALSRVGLDGLSDQGFIFKTVSEKDTAFVICSGGGDRGNAYAVIELIKALQRKDGQLLLEATDRREEPFFIRRGMYAHQHWAYEYPYALRSWGFEDWRRYIDMLAYLRINFFSIWSMCGILPTPLSEGDRQYLENYRKVIDYAKNKRGMEVFIGECGNNVAESDGGVPVQQRDYFQVEVLKDPSDPKQFADIMENRRNLYSTANNADGYWIIDSDPGGWEGSPVSEFVDILEGNRQLIDECTIKGKNAKLAYWMWAGWGKGLSRDECQERVRQTVEMMRDRLHEPWLLFPCWGNHLDYALELGYIDKSIFFPYGSIEDEPAPPTTRLRFDEIYFHLNNCISFWGGRNAMGNAQSPLAQLPNIFFFAQTTWYGVPPAERLESETIEPLAKQIAPDIAKDLAKGWLLLKGADVAEVLAQADRLDQIAAEGRVGEPGTVGRFFFPNISKLITDLALQLRVHAKAVQLADALERTEPFDKVFGYLFDYEDAAIAWHSVHNFRRYTCYGPDINRIAEQWRAYRDKISLPVDYSSRLKSDLLGKGYDEWMVEGYLALTPPE